jgi:hypothetical protein
MDVSHYSQHATAALPNPSNPHSHMVTVTIRQSSGPSMHINFSVPRGGLYDSLSSEVTVSDGLVGVGTSVARREGRVSLQQLPVRVMLSN